MTADSEFRRNLAFASGPVVEDHKESEWANRRPSRRILRAGLRRNRSQVVRVSGFAPTHTRKLFELMSGWLGEWSAGFRDGHVGPNRRPVPPKPGSRIHSPVASTHLTAGRIPLGFGQQSMGQRRTCSTESIFRIISLKRGSDCGVSART
jgi:hypothetical protein